MALSADVPDEILNLNVGGSIYATSRSTLTRYPDSMLGSMFSDRLPSNVDDHNRYIIDGDGPTFRHILNFLRRSKLVLPDGFQEWDILSAEADYYQLQELIQLINEKRIPQPDNDQPDTYEYVEVEAFYEGPRQRELRIFCKPKLIEQSLAATINHRQKELTGNEYDAPLQGTLRAEYSGYLIDLRSSHIESFYVNRLKLFRDITKCGFTLISTSSIPLGHNGGPISRPNIRDKWTFSRKEVAED